MFRRIRVEQKLKQAVGFIKKIDTKKMILVAGISLLSIFSFSTIASADPEPQSQDPVVTGPKVTGELRKAGTSTTKYQLKITDFTCSNFPQGLEIYKTSVSNDNKLATGENGAIKILEKINDQEILAVVELTTSDNIAKLCVTDDNNTSTEVDLSSIPDFDVSKAIKIKGEMIKYSAEEYGDYIHLTVESGARIWKIKDKNSNERIWLKEKEVGDEVTLKYILKDGEKTFTIYDVFETSLEVNIEKALLQVEFNAKDTDGTKFAFKPMTTIVETIPGQNQSDQETTITYTLVEMKTGAGEEIAIHDGSTKGEDSWANNYKYETDCEGTTKLLLKYQADNPAYDSQNPSENPQYLYKTFEVPLWLDVTEPEGIYYKIDNEEILSSFEINGDIVSNNYTKYNIERVKGDIRKLVTDVPNVTGHGEGGGHYVKLRAYVNNKTHKCIVEVRDIQSGIDKIELCKMKQGADENTDINERYEVITSNDASKQAEIDASNYNSYGELRPSVLHLFKFEDQSTFNEEIAAVRVTDGLGNFMYTPVTKSASGAGAGTIDNNNEDSDTLILAWLVEEHVWDSNTNKTNTIYKIVAQDYKAGLWKIERDGVNNALIDFSDPAQLTVNTNKVNVTKDISGSFVKYECEEGSVENESNNRVKITVDGDRYEQYTIRRVTRTITQQGQPVLTVYDALGNTRTVTFDQLAFGCTYATYNGEDSLAVNIKEMRGIWKITAKILETGKEQAATYTLEVFAEDNEPTRLIKTYQVPAGEVQEITVYHTRPKSVDATQYQNNQAGLEAAQNEALQYAEALNNKINGTPRGNYCAKLKSLTEIKVSLDTATNKQDVLNELINVTSADIKTGTVKEVVIDQQTGEPVLDQDNNPQEQDVSSIVGATVRAKHGIKRVEYDDGTVMDFYKELPTKLYVNCKIGNYFNGAVVIDATGCPITIAQNNVTLDYIAETDEDNVSLRVVSPA